LDCALKPLEKPETVSGMSFDAAETDSHFAKIGPGPEI
jgi:hypothetical protein